MMNMLIATINVFAAVVKTIFPLSPTGIVATTVIFSSGSIRIQLGDVDGTPNSEEFEGDRQENILYRLLLHVESWNWEKSWGQSREIVGEMNCTSSVSRNGPENIH